MTRDTTDLRVQKTVPIDQVGVRLGSKDLEKIDAVIDVGSYMNRADFVRAAVREKLESIDIITQRSVSREVARKEILEYIENNGRSYASDIALALKLDLDLVFSVLEELRKKGVVE